MYQQNGAMKRSTTDSLAHPSHGKTFKHMTGHANWAWQITQPFELIDESLAASNAMHMQAQCMDVNKHRDVQNSALLKRKWLFFYEELTWLKYIARIFLAICNICT